MAKIIVLAREQHYKSKVPGRVRAFLLGKDVCGSEILKADTVTYQPDASGGEHYHNCESFIYVMQGECDMTINGTPNHISEHTMVFLAPGDRHFIKNAGKTPMVMLEAFAPQSRSESIWTNPNQEHGWVPV
jgi:quercetin dioxygenase-like cupin family protein